MKRAEALWQVVILCLVFLSVVGVYGMLAHVLQRRWGSGQLPTFASSAESGGAVQIVAPLDGEVVQHGAPIAVRASLVEAGFVQAELRADGVGLGIQVNPDPEAVPWLAEWIWEEAGEGSHRLTAQARKSEGEWETTAPVTVTVVPTGALAFASNRDGAYAIYVVRTDGRGVTRLTVGPGNAQQPAWGADGMLAFVAETATGRTVIRTLEEETEAATDLFTGRDPAWSQSDAYLAYATAVDGVSQVFTAAVGESPPVQLTQEESYAGQPTWSPDGSSVAYVVERERNWDIWVAMLDRSEPRQLTEDPAMDWAPAWSPDGSRLAFVSSRGGSHQIYTMRADGASVERLTDFPQGAESPAWSPDGYWLAFVAYTGEGAGVNAREIYLMRADGRDQVRLTRNSFDDNDPDWSWER